MADDRPRIYHNPRCSKSRETLQILEQQDTAPEIVEYLQTPPDADELRQIIALLGVPARELLRDGEDAYREAGLDAKDLDEIPKTPEKVVKGDPLDGTEDVVDQPAPTPAPSTPRAWSRSTRPAGVHAST